MLMGISLKVCLKQIIFWKALINLRISPCVIRDSLIRILKNMDWVNCRLGMLLSIKATLRMICFRGKVPLRILKLILYIKVDFNQA